MKVLVLGALGMAGHTISMYFDEKGHDVTTFDKKPFACGRNIVGDAMDSSLLKNILSDDFDLVINCIGILNQYAEDNHSLATYLNSYLPHFLANALKDKKGKLIHISTDCVFSGESGSYRETSNPDSTSFYGRSKALGEISDHKNLTIRTSIVGPDLNPAGIGLFNWFMKQEGAINGYANAMWTGVTTLTLAKAIEKAYNITGLYNLTPANNISKLCLLGLFNKAFKADTLTINPVYEPKVDKSLLCTRTDFNFTVPSYEEMVVEMKDWVVKYTEMYPHYRITS